MLFRSRAGLLRLERNRQGILRVFPGTQMSQLQRAATARVDQPAALEPPMVPYDVEEQPQVQESETEPVIAATPEEITEPQTEEPAEPTAEPAAGTAEEPVRKRRASSGLKRKTVVPRKSAGTTVKRARKKASPPPEEGSVP